MAIFNSYVSLPEGKHAKKMWSLPTINVDHKKRGKPYGSFPHLNLLL